MKKIFLKNVPIQRLLLLIYASLLIGLLAIRLIEYKNMQQTGNIISELLNKSISRQRILTQMRKGSDYVHVNVLRYLFYTDKEARGKAEKIMYASIKKNDSNLVEYEELISGRQELQLFNNLKAHRVQNANNRAILIKLITEGKQDEAVNFNSYFLLNSFEDFQQSNTALADYVSKRDETNIQDSENHLITIEKTNIWLNAAIFLLLILLGLILGRAIQKLRSTNLLLAESERKYRSLIENTNEIINQCDNKGTLVFVNDYCKKKLEYNEEEISHLTVLDILSEESKHLYKPNPTKAECGDIIIGMRQTLKSKTGKKILTEGNVLLEYKNEKFSGATGFFNDVTEKIHAEEALIASEERYRQLFDLTHIPMWIFNPETFSFIQVNRAAINNYGYSEKEFLEMTIMDIRPAEDVLKVKEISREKNKGNDIFKGSFRHIKKSSEKIDVEIFSTPVLLNGQWLTLVTAMDVTEKNLFEQRLTRSIIKTQEDERYEIGGELHDNVCQLLATCQLFLGMIKPSLLPEQKKFFDQTHEYITLAIQEIRNLSHRLAPAFFDGTTLEDAFKNLLTKFNIENKYHISLSFDTLSKSYPLNPDMRLNLYRILQEQLRNILKHSRAKSIEVGVTKNDNALQMSISDNGVGFDAKGSKGGIGLENMNRRVRLFSGKFLIQSEVGKGCKVIVEIPLSGNN